jgi:hypothetical protein
MFLPPDQDYLVRVSVAGGTGLRLVQYQLTIRNEP